MIRILVSAAFVVALSLPALAQQRPGGQPQRPPAPAQPAPAPQAQPQDVFPCRTPAEVCFLGIVIGDKVAVLYTNAQQSEDIGDQPIDAFTDAASGGTPTRLDLRQHNGRVVMLTGNYQPKAGLFRAEIVEVASPLLSLALKAIMSGGDEPQPEQQPPGRREPQGRPQPQRGR